MTKLDRAARFRERISQAIRDAKITQSALARQIGTDRSTLSQILSDDGARLPGAHVVGACASALGVSADWLLSLSDRPETASELLSATLTFSQAPRAVADDQISAWYREASGAKIRHVPATLPDMIKTDAVIEWEYGPHLGRTTQQAINAAQERRAWLRASGSDAEIAMPLFEIESFATGTGYYRGLPQGTRRVQIDQLIEMADTMYPRLRFYLFDARKLYSAPVTIFGTQLASFFTGGHYMTFRDRERILTFSNDFDILVREARVTDRAFAGHLRDLRKLIR